MIKEVLASDQPLTFEEIQQRRAEVYVALRRQADRMQRVREEIFDTSPRQEAPIAWTGLLTNVLALYQGVRQGVKFYNRIRRLFRNKG